MMRWRKQRIRRRGNIAVEAIVILGIITVISVIALAMGIRAASSLHDLISNVAGHPFF